ncbi:ankyrin repeat domain-containing protein 16 isoform X2 [Rhipicephalus microplus]|uniref:ankyrin repeat domain-containing protein 16 isoform X2 n=1 Tax=Rhipicephalus microplus TaxID=6941 RepID=UPI001889049C|nr:ankyrin repeat domain-containing protein 16-like isoform X2 [Rhipicephalus microplus]
MEEGSPWFQVQESALAESCVMVYRSFHEAKQELIGHVQRDRVDGVRLVLGKEYANNVEQAALCLRTITHGKCGDTLAHIACRCGSLNILRFLCEEVKCLLESQNRDGKRPLHEAAQLSRLDIVQFLIDQGCQIDPLKRADWEGHVHIMSSLLDLFPDAWNTSSRNKRTPLHTAALHGQLQCVKLLLMRGDYPPDVADNCGTTPFMDAASADQVAILDCLAELQKADVTMMDMLGNNSLHLAAQAGAASAVLSLVEKYGLDINSINTWGQTPLHLSAKAGQDDVVQLLIVLGAVCSVRDKKGRTAYDLAKNNGHNTCCLLLQSHNMEKQ